MIQLLEIVWEVSWKAMRDHLSAQGFTENLTSPADVIRTAFASGLIDDAQCWMDAGKLRKTLAHEYHPDRAALALDVIATLYTPLFQALLRELTNAGI